MAIGLPLGGFHPAGRVEITTVDWQVTEFFPLATSIAQRFLPINATLIIK
jgi:hypothetical protein